MEYWRNVQGYEGYYKVSNQGRVRSLDREIVGRDGVKTKYKGKLLAPRYLRDGAIGVVLSKKGTSISFKVHRLVAQAHLPNPNQAPTNPDQDLTKPISPTLTKPQPTLIKMNEAIQQAVYYLIARFTVDILFLIMVIIVLRVYYTIKN